jgi:hypothetical protein
MRWSEEVQLLQEEMERVLRYFRWKVRWWDEVSAREGFEGNNKGLAEGRTAYAKRHALMYTAMGQRCVALWEKLPDLVGQHCRLYRADYIPGTGIFEPPAPVLPIS